MFTSLKRLGPHKINEDPSGSIFDREALVPHLDRAWDDHDLRLKRYMIYDAYYSNDIYDSILTWSASHKHSRKLYKHIRGIFNPVKRYVELYTAIVYGGEINFEQMTDGAIPIKQASPQMMNALRTLWDASRMQQKKSLFVRHTTRFGDCAIKIVDDRFRQMVKMEFLHPGKIADVDYDTSGEISRIVIQYDRIDSQTEETYTYTEIITPEMFFTLRDGEPFAFFEDEIGEPVSQWKNPYGFIPVELVPFRDIDFKFGIPGFHDSMRKIDEHNDQASLIYDSVRKAVDVWFYLAGGDADGDLQIKTAESNRDDAKLITGPEGSNPVPLNPELQIQEAIGAMDKIMIEIKKDMPELSLDEIRSGSNLTDPGVRAGYADAVGSFENTMSNLDGGLVRAQRKAVAVGGGRGYPGYEGFGFDDWLSPRTRHTIALRDIFQDRLSRRDLIQLFIDIGVPPASILRQAGVSEAAIAEMLPDIEQERARQIAATVRTIAESAFSDDNMEDEA